MATLEDIRRASAPKLAALREALRALDGALVAFSGGVDSTFVLAVARDVLGDRAVALTAHSPSVPQAERSEARELARRLGVRHLEVESRELDDPRYAANPVDRCYYCKTNLYARIRSLTSDAIASGTNVDDLSDFRPGLRAAEERGVVHPYVEAGIDKSTIYAIAAELDLDDLERLPAQPCLSSRVETGIAIDENDLAFIDAVESRLAAKLGREHVLRCRVTRTGIVIELGDSRDDAVAIARAIAEDACRAARRTFAGVRAYVRGAAFIRTAQND
jgi:uncharacterized protein